MQSTYNNLLASWFISEIDKTNGYDAKANQKVEYGAGDEN